MLLYKFPVAAYSDNNYASYFLLYCSLTLQKATVNGNIKKIYKLSGGGKHGLGRYQFANRRLARKMGTSENNAANFSNKIGIQFCSITYMDETGKSSSKPATGYRIYDNFEESYDFSRFSSISDMTKEINADTVIPFILKNFPGGKADRVTLRKHGCYLNNTFIDASEYNRKHYPMYVMPELSSCNDLGTIPLSVGHLVAALFRENESGGTIALRVKESAQIQYKGAVYSTPSQYPVELFRPISHGSNSTSEMKVQKRNIFEVFRETDSSKTSLYVIPNQKLPKPNELFEFLFAYIDADI